MNKQTSEARLALIETLLAKDAALSAAGARIGARPADAEIPASFAQEGVWVEQMLDPENDTFNMQFSLRFEGELDNNALCRAIVSLVQECEILRTVFKDEGRQLKQIVLPEYEAVVRASVMESNAALIEAIRRERKRPFDLKHEPGFRTHLYTLEAAEHVLCVTVHHIIADGWSLNILVDELEQRYLRECGGEGRGGHKAIQYADYAWWQRLGGGREKLEAQVQFWSDKLAGAEPAGIPMQGPLHRCAATEVEDSGVFGFRIGESECQSLDHLCSDLKVTRFTVLMAVYALTLFKCGNARDSWILTPLAARNHVEVENVIGLFVSMIPLRVSLEGDPTVRGLLTMVHEALTQARDNSDCPYGYIEKSLGWNQSRPLDTLLTMSYHTRWTGSGALASARWTPRLQVRPQLPDRLAGNFGLNLAFVESPAGLQGAAIYRTQSVRKEFLKTFVECFLDLLSRVAARPDARLSSFALGKMDERVTSVGWTHNPEKPTGLVHEIVRRRALDRPDSVALVRDGVAMTYGELEARARRAAGHLADLGIGPCSRVGIALAPGPDMVAAMLATLKTGACYVPIDPAQPRGDLVPLDILICESVECAQREDEDVYLRTTAIPSAELERKRLTDDLPERTVSELQIAYIIYTSGSTGEPKGVCVCHQSIVNLALRPDYADLGPDSNVAQASTPLFDAATFEIWGALLNGARLTFVDKETLLDADLLRRTLAGGIDTLFLTTALFNQHMRNQADMFGGIRNLLFGGEQADKAAVRQAVKHCCSGCVKHVYGPTEATTFTTACQIQSPMLNGDLVPIGDPVRGMRTYVLDQDLNPVPRGFPGQLYVAGYGVAVGYDAQAWRTASVFLPDPFAREPGARMYATGDYVATRLDGLLEFLGRKDRQTKIRGYRIEVGQVEAVLRSHHAVREAVVVARTEAATPHLDAYWLPSDTVGGAEDLKAYLKDRLPAYLIPTHLVTISEIPLNQNGKIDLSQLQCPGANSRCAGKSDEPRNEQEGLLIEIWRDVLDVDTIGRQANYFDAGGDSLTAIEIKSRAEEHGYTFQLADFFYRPTIADLAEAMVRKPIENSENSDAFSLINVLDRRLLPSDAVDAYPMSLLQQGMVFHQKAGQDIYREIVTYRIGLRFEHRVMQQVLAAVAKRHEILRTAFETCEYSEPLQIVFGDADIPLVVVDLTGLPSDKQAEKLEAWSEAESRRPLDLAQPSILNVNVHVLSAREFQFEMSAHHTIWDGHSEGLLLLEIIERYKAALEGLHLHEVPLKGRYRDFIAAEREAMLSETTRRFWRDMFHGHESLPSTRPTGEEKPARSVEIRLPDDVARELFALAAKLGVSIKSVLFAAHTKALAVFTGNPDVVSGLVTNGRPETADSEKIIGLFLNTVPIRWRLARVSWLDLVREAAAVEVRMMPHRRFPMQETARMLGRPLLFDVLFNYIGFRVRDPGDGKTLSFIKDRAGHAENSVPIAVTFARIGRDKVHGGIAYRPSHYTNQDIERFASIFSNVLRAMATNPEDTHHGDSLIPAADDAKLEAWSKGAACSRKQFSITTLFEEQVRRRTSSVALIRGEDSCTYAELDRYSEQIAIKLEQRGTRRGDIVAMAMESSIEAVATMIATIKIGAAYLPLDPSFPESRLAQILADSGATTLAMSNESGDVGSESPTSRLVVRRDESQDVSRRTSCDPITGDELAYVLYTSGSTGVPKGVCISQKALITLVCDENLARFDESTVALQMTPLIFDPSVLEIWGALLNGGTLVIPESSRRSLGDIARLIRKHDVNIVWLTTPLFHALIDECLGELTQVSTVMAGGDVLSPTHVRKLLGAQAAVTVINGYGPTEVTMLATAHNMQKWNPAWTSVPIGKPVAETKLFVLDENLNRVPVATWGELFVSGVGLAWGYLGQPVLTAQAFVPCPFAEAPGSRLYRTGDICRWNEDGELEFLGRRDKQVKVGGHRVELGEVERAILEHPNVKEAAVVVQVEVGGAKRLIGHVKMQNASDTVNTELRQWLARRIPRFMIPSDIVVRETMPLMPSGKIDRQALLDTACCGVEGSEPMGETEQLLAAIWADLLGIASIAREDNFFSLGADSLLALRLVQRIHRTFGVELPLSVLLESPDLSAMSNNVEGMTKVGGSPSIVLQRGGPNTVFLLHPVGGGVVCYRSLASRLNDCTVVGLMRPELGTLAPPKYQSVEELTAIYVDAIRSHQAHGPYRLLGWSMGGLLAYQAARTLRDDGEEIALLGLIDSAVLPESAGPDFDENTAVSLLGRTLDDDVRRLRSKDKTDTQILQRYQQVLEYNHRAMLRYRPTRSNQLIVDNAVLFRATDNPFGHTNNRLISSTHGWEDLLMIDTLAVNDIACDHYAILDEPYVDVVATTINAALA